MIVIKDIKCSSAGERACKLMHLHKKMPHCSSSMALLAQTFVKGLAAIKMVQVSSCRH
jgi:hypothetical protein